MISVEPASCRDGERLNDLFLKMVAIVVRTSLEVSMRGGGGWLRCVGVAEGTSKRAGTRAVLRLPGADQSLFLGSREREKDIG